MMWMINAGHSGANWWKSDNESVTSYNKQNAKKISKPTVSHWKKGPLEVLCLSLNNYPGTAWHRTKTKCRLKWTHWTFFQSNFSLCIFVSFEKMASQCRQYQRLRLNVYFAYNSSLNNVRTGNPILFWILIMSSLYIHFSQSWSINFLKS
jgi:hypothetical protein